MVDKVSHQKYDRISIANEGGQHMINSQGYWWNKHCGLLFDEDEDQCPRCHGTKPFRQLYLPSSTILKEPFKRRVRSKYHSRILPGPNGGKQKYYAAAPEFLQRTTGRSQ